MGNDDITYCPNGEITLQSIRVTIKLLKKSELVPNPAVVKCGSGVLIPARSEIGITAFLERNPSEVEVDGYDGVTDPESINGNNDDSLVARSVSSVHKGQTLVRVANVSLEAVQLSCGVPLGKFYPTSTCEKESSSLVGHVMYEVLEIGSELINGAVSSGRLLDARRNQQNRVPNIDLSDSNLTVKEEKKVMKLVEKYSDIFSKDKRNLGRTDLIKHELHTTEALPIKQKPFRLLKQHMKQARNQLEEIIEDGIVEKSTSPCCSPVVLAKKKDGTLRFCTDFRKLNAITITDAYPLPRVDDALDKLSGSIWFSSFDLSSGYWQVEIAPKDRSKTVFSLGNGLWQYTVMPFGLKNAPPTFQRLIELVLAGLDWESCLVYLDYILLFSPTFDDHLLLLEEVFKKLRCANLKLKPAKCNLSKEEVVYLDHLVSRIPNETDGEEDLNCLEDQTTLVHGKDPEIDVISMQQQDSVLRKVIEWIKEGIPRRCDVENYEKLKKWFFILHELALKNGILCLRWKMDNTADGIIQIVIPEKVVDKIIASYHDESGHFGMKKTLSKIRASYFWVGMAKDIENLTLSCQVCQQRKQPIPKMRAPLQSIETTRPLEVVGIDIVEFTKSKSGNPYRLVMVDLFRKYLNIYLLKDQTAKMIAWNIQNKYVCHHGAPEQLHSDQGKNLNAQTVKDVCGYLHVWKTRTTPYRPQSDGQTERTITVVDLLAKYCSEGQDDWDEYLDSICLCL